MPEWGTVPSNHYLPRRKTVINISADQLVRADSPKQLDVVAPPNPGEKPRSTLDDAANFSG